MRDRQKTIDFDRNYCAHYRPKPGLTKGTDCEKGVDIRELPRVSPEPGKPKWAPCIGGHLLDDPKAICPHWERRSMEEAEKRADDVERMFKMMEESGPVISEWRKKPPVGKQEVIECPCCKGRLHLSQAAYNGHVAAKCETAGCINFIE